MSSPPVKRLPASTQPTPDPKLLRQRLSILAWARVGFGALAGVLAGLLNFLTIDFDPSSPVANPNAYYGFYVAILVYLLSYYLAKYWLVKDIGQKDKNKLITQGIGSYIIMFLFVWILYNTSCYIGLACFHI